MKTTATTQNNSGNRREFADFERVIVTGEWGHSGGRPVTQEVATDYARAQLFDLIDRTQNENQARAVREANEQRKAA